MKKVIAACIDQVLLFDSIKYFDDYEAKLSKEHLVKMIGHKEDGSVEARIKISYNNNTLLDR